jgi:hypothetical protein
MEIVRQAIEILISFFAGYCGLYFITMKLFKMEPEEFVGLFWTTLAQKIEEAQRKRKI